MSNQVLEKIFNDIETQELLSAIDQILEDGKKRIIREGGIVRKYAKILNERSDGAITMHMALLSAEISLFREAGIRWARDRREN